MSYGPEVISQVQSMNDIVEVITSYVPLKRAGRSFKACCPFHGEKTPSFMVQSEKQLFHCFGCGIGGDVYSFVMKHENITFPEALRLLADRAHFELPETDPHAMQKRTEAEKLYETCARSTDYFYANLKRGEAGARARAYLAKRGFGEREIESFRIGLALEDWHGLQGYLTSKRIPEAEQLRSGLVLRSAKGHVYDLFRNRIMFPILNVQGKGVAFGGRTLEAVAPKYINSPETMIFRKRREMYGLHKARRAMTSTGDLRTALVVEGYLDCIRLHMNGFPNTVATLGTSLTQDHVRILKRYTDEAVFFFDGDQAGEQASLRGLDIFVEEGMSVKVLCLPTGLDPDDFVRKYGSEGMTKLLEKKQDFFDYKLQVLLNRYNKADSLGLLKITSEFLDTFSRMSNPVLVDRYLKRLALTLGVEEGSLRSELNKLKSRSGLQGQHEPRPMKTQPEGHDAQPPVETHLLSLVLNDSSYLERFMTEHPHYQFMGSKTRQIFRHVTELVRVEGNYEVPMTKLLSRIHSEPLKSFMSELLVMSGDEDLDRERAFRDCLRSLTMQDQKERLNALRREIARAEQADDQESLLKLMKAYQELLVLRDHVTSERPQ